MVSVEPRIIGIHPREVTSPIPVREPVRAISERRLDELDTEDVLGRLHLRLGSSVVGGLTSLARVVVGTVTPWDPEWTAFIHSEGQPKCRDQGDQTHDSANDPGSGLAPTTVARPLPAVQSPPPVALSVTVFPEIVTSAHEKLLFSLVSLNQLAQSAVTWTR